MNEQTARALAAINRAFYEEHAHAFSETRSRPWQGWRRLVPRLRELASGARGGALRVLDVGCGNGRFGRFLAEALPDTALQIDAVDASAPLLDEARRDAPVGTRFHRVDAAERPQELPAGPFELAVLFGVIHGIPGRERRLALLRACAERLAPGGLLVFTAWRVEHDPRLAGRRVAWERFNARAGAPVDTRELEPGDGLLPWGEGDAVLRYVHAFAEEELRELGRALPLVAEAHFRADGPGGDANEYLVFRAP